MKRALGGAALAAAAALLVSPAAALAQGSGGGLSQQDKTWMSQNAQTNLAEIAAGKLAEQKATSGPTRQLGVELVADHTTAMTKLTALAKQLYVTLPGAPNAMQQAQAKQLMALSGAAFDRTFDQAQIKGHLLSIEQTQKEINTGSNAAVKARASAYLPVAEMHLENARKALSQTQMQQVPSGSVAAGGAGTAGVENVGLLATGGGAVLAGGVLAGVLVLSSRRRRASL